MNKSIERSVLINAIFKKRKEALSFHTKAKKLDNKRYLLISASEITAYDEILNLIKTL